jgi:hypothetical protein
VTEGDAGNDAAGDARRDIATDQQGRSADGAGVLLNPGLGVGCVVAGIWGKDSGSRSDNHSQQRAYASFLALVLAYKP